MLDPANPAATPDTQHIDVRDPAQVERWSKALGVTPDQLRDVVAAAGGPGGGGAPAHPVGPRRSGLTRGGDQPSD